MFVKELEEEWMKEWNEIAQRVRENNSRKTKEIEENGKKVEQTRCTIQTENQLCSTSIDKHPGINLLFPTQL